MIWGRSAVGSAFEWHSKGRRFDPDRLHQIESGRNSRSRLFFYRNEWLALQPIEMDSLCREDSPLPSLWSYAPHARTDFSYTRKVSKSVCKGTPLAQPRGGTSPLRGVDFPHSALKGTFPLTDEETTLMANGERDRRSPRGKTPQLRCVVPQLCCVVPQLRCG